MSIRPDAYPDWATDTEDNGTNNTANKVEPSAPKKAKGWGFPEKPPRGEFNYMMNKVGEWIRYFANPTYATQVDTYVAVAGDRILPDNSAGALTINLPATPSIGDTVYFRQQHDQPFSVNNLTVGRNGSTILGAASDFTISVTDDIEFECSYDGITWIVLKTKEIGLIT